MSLQILHYSDVENAYDDSDQIGHLAGLINSLRDRETIVCGSGDNTGPGVLSLVTQGQQALEFFRAVEPHVDTFGNHDFDHGPEALLEVVRNSPQTWVCANAFRNGKRFAAKEGTKPWTVVAVGEYRVGIIGVANPDTSSINPYAGDVQFTAPVPAVETSITALREQAVDNIVVISHLGDDSDLASAVDADVILGGHDHSKLNEYIDGTLVGRPGANGQSILEVSFEGEQPAAAHHTVDEGPMDTDVASALDARAEAAGLTEIVGTVEEPIVCDMMASKRGESRLGNLIMDAYRWKSGADIALYPSGGFRRRPPLSGQVTPFDLIGIIPFERDLLVLEVTGKTLLLIFRQAALAHIDENPEWFFGHVSGAELVWDDVDSEFREIQINGHPVDPKKTYQIATSEFFVENDLLLPEFKPEYVTESYGPEYDVLVDYVRDVGISPKIEGRIQRPTINEGKIPRRNWPFSP